MEILADLKRIFQRGNFGHYNNITFFLRLSRGLEDILISFSLTCSSRTRMSCRAIDISSYDKENIAFEVIYSVIAQNFPKTNISYPLICTHKSTYQGVRKASFSEHFACALNGRSLCKLLLHTLLFLYLGRSQSLLENVWKCNEEAVNTAMNCNTMDTENTLPWIQQTLNWFSLYFIHENVQI